MLLQKINRNLSGMSNMKAVLIAVWNSYLLINSLFSQRGGELILNTDAFGADGTGTVLSQRQDGKEKIISYFSRVLNKAERNYCVTQRELLSLIELIKLFHYLYSRKFLIQTDHMLQRLMSFKDLESQLICWIEKLQQYDFEIIYRKGVFSIVQG